MQPLILVVDDEQPVRSMLKIVLETNGYQVNTASSAAEAVILCQTRTYDVVLTDMRMETDSAGFEVVAAARAQSYHPGIIILTAFPMTASEWKEAGADFMIAKPMVIDKLLQICSDLVAHRLQAVKN